jgi:hypothetical protein
MPQNLMSFLSDLAVSPEKLARYQENPDEAMQEAGLNADERTALKSGDPAKVYASILAQSASKKPSTGPANCASAAPADAVCVALPADCVVVPPVCIAIRLADAVCVVQPQTYPIYSYYFAKLAPSILAPSEPASQPGSQSSPSERGPGKTP